MKSVCRDEISRDQLSGIEIYTFHEMFITESVFMFVKVFVEFIGGWWPAVLLVPSSFVYRMVEWDKTNGPRGIKAGGSDDRGNIENPNHVQNSSTIIFRRTISFTTETD